MNIRKKIRLKLNDLNKESVVLEDMKEQNINNGLSTHLIGILIDINVNKIELLKSLL